MPVSASQYSMDAAFEGQVASLQNYSHIKGIQDEIVNAQDTLIPFGRFVVSKPDGEPGEIQLPTASNQSIVGIVPLQDRFERDSYGNSGIPPKQMAGVMVKGIVWVRVETNIARGASVYVRHSENENPTKYEGLGRIRSDADLSKASILSNVKLLDDAIAGGLARLELDLPTTTYLSL